MAFSNRSRFDIMANILQKAVPGMKKTWLLYGANLSFSQLRRYLKTLVDLQLLAVKDDLYTTTPKGLAFLESYKTLVQLLEEPEVQARNAKKELKRDGMVVVRRRN